MTAGAQCIPDQLRQLYNHQHNITTRPLSLLSLNGVETSSSQIAVMLCGWGINARWLMPYVDRQTWRVADKTMWSVNIEK